MTGTSWGSAGTIGVVLIGVANALGADLGVTAGAVIGGAYFGDKLSPLSDTTNIAAIAAEVDLYDHIQSMMVTTLPSALIAAVTGRKARRALHSQEGSAPIRAYGLPRGACDNRFSRAAPPEGDPGAALRPLPPAVNA